MKNTKLGQTLSEYLILIALVAVGSIAVVQVLGSNVRSRIGTISEALRGHKKEIKGEELREEHYRIQDMGDFQNALKDTDN